MVQIIIVFLSFCRSVLTILCFLVNDKKEGLIIVKKILSIADTIFVLFISSLFVLQIFVTLGIVNFGDDVIFQNIHVLIYNCVVYIVYCIYNLVSLTITLLAKIKLFYKKKVISFMIATLIIIISFLITNI